MHYHWYLRVSESGNEVVNSEIKFRVESFTLILNKSEYELARVTAGNLETQISLRDGNLAVSGQLGSLSLLDQSPHGTKYTQRFVSVGKQVMQFKLFKWVSFSMSPALQDDNYWGGGLVNF